MIIILKKIGDISHCLQYNIKFKNIFDHVLYIKHNHITKIEN